MADRNVASFASLVAEEDIILPSQADSGAVVRVRKPNVIRLMHEGNVVDFLSPLVEQWIKPTVGKVKQEGNIEVIISMLKAVPELEPRVNTIVGATMIEPKLSAEQVESLSVRDRVAVLLWAMGEEFGDLQAMFRGLTQQSQRLQSVGEIPTVE